MMIDGIDIYLMHRRIKKLEEDKEKMARLLEEAPANDPTFAYVHEDELRELLNKEEWK